MSKQTATIDDNETVLVGTVKARRQTDSCKCMFFASGTFGGGTLTWYWSPDEGTTKYPITDDNWVVIPMKSISYFTHDFPIGTGMEDELSIYATMADATTPDVTAGFYVNN